jgi:hypothetical protein
MTLECVEFFRAKHGRVRRLAERPDSFLAHARRSGDDRFIMIILLQAPLEPRGHHAMYFALPNDAFDPEGETWKTLTPEARAARPAVQRCWERFLAGDEEYRKPRWKVIPGIPEGGWVVQNTIGNKPALLATKLTHEFYYYPPPAYPSPAAVASIHGSAAGSGAGAGAAAGEASAGAAEETPAAAPPLPAGDVDSSSDSGEWSGTPKPTQEAADVEAFAGAISSGVAAIHGDSSTSGSASSSTGGAASGAGARSSDDAPFAGAGGVGGEESHMHSTARAGVVYGNYLELDCDVGSSKMATLMFDVINNNSKRVVVDLAFMVEAREMDELPEQILGTIRLVHPEILTTPVLDIGNIERGDVAAKEKAQAEAEKAKGKRGSWGSWLFGGGKGDKE